MTNSSPLVSILVPSYNYAHLIVRCLDSVLKQTYTNWELIICDDQSSDDSLAVLHQYANHPQVQIHLNETNLGLYPNIVRCLSYASGEFIKILMADDWLHPDYLEDTLALFARYPSIGLCSVSTEVFNDEGRLVTRREEPELARCFYPHDDLLLHTRHLVNPIGNPSRVIFRRAAYDEVGGFDLDLEYCTENDLWLRILEKWDAAFAPRILSYELLHEQNATRDYVRDARHLITGEQMNRKLFDSHPYFQNHAWRQQQVWLQGWREYWDAAIRHKVEGNPAEFNTLVAILGRNAWPVLWIPLLGWRFAYVIGRKAFLKLANPQNAA